MQKKLIKDIKFKTDIISASNTEKCRELEEIVSYYMNEKGVYGRRGSKVKEEADKKGKSKLKYNKHENL